MATASPREFLHASAANADLTVTTGASTAAGDVLVLFHASDGSTAASMVSPTPGAWAQEDVADLGASTAHIKCWTRPVASAGPQTVTVPKVGSADHGVHLYVVSGADTADPTDATANATGAASTSHVAPSVSPATAGALLLSAVVAEVFSSGDYTAVTGGMTDLTEDDLIPAATFATMASARQALTASGPTGTRTFTYSQAKAFAAITVAIRGVPDANTAPVTVPATVAIPAPTARESAAATPVKVTAVAAIPTPTVQQGGRATPATVTAGTVIPAPTAGASAVAKTRTFDSFTDETIICSPGGMAGNDGGPIAVLALWKPVASPVQSGLIQARNAAGALVWGLLMDSGRYYAENTFAAGPAPVANQWQLIGYEKGSGSATIRWHLYRFDTQTWSHTAGDTIGDSTAGPVATVWLGNAHHRANGQIAVLGVLDGVLGNDAAWEGAGLHTALQAWVNAGLTAVWPMNQNATADPVVDVVGTADETSRLDPADVSTDVPAGFSWALGASGSAQRAAGTVTAAAAIPRPTVLGGASAAKSLATVTAAASIAAPTVRTGVSLYRSTVEAVAVIPTPAVHQGGRVTLTTVHGVAAIDAPTLLAGTVPPKPGRARVRVTSRAATVRVTSPPG